MTTEFVLNPINANTEKYLSTSESDEGSEQMDDSEPEYEVEKVIKKRVINGKVEYLLKWLNFSPENNTWEPITMMSCDELIDNYENDINKRFKITFNDIFGDNCNNNELSNVSDTSLGNDSGIGGMSFNDNENIGCNDNNKRVDTTRVKENKRQKAFERRKSVKKVKSVSSDNKEIKQSDNQTEDRIQQMVDNDSDSSCDFMSQPSIFDLSLSESNIVIDLDEMTINENINNKSVDNLLKMSDNSNDNLLPITPNLEDRVESFTSDSLEVTKNKKVEVFTIDDSDDEEDSVYETPKVSKDRTNYRRKQRNEKQINYQNIAEIVIISDSEEESLVSHTNDTNDEDINENTTKTKELSFKNNILNSDNSSDNNNKIYDKIIGNNKSSEREINGKNCGNDYESDDSEKELVIDIPINVDKVLDMGLIVNEFEDIEDQYE
ncbi:putative uncharacterized protein DDB_G0282133 [Oppia nitens]|uniref:putative uncharacterized protein DDB_G0282133 n=1 Tax=Oppia nitens TaxID=1686743 RepID=UPI0023DAE32D|nr:putative uncharacterized protein DDB_G0282133 [Oppia nitens]